jgi:hypothetical protein
MGEWLTATVLKAKLYARVLFAATLGLLPVHAFAQAPQSDESPSPAGLGLSRIGSISRSLGDWLQDSVRSLGDKKFVAQPGACANGFATGCAYVDRWWFGERANEHYEGALRDGALNGHGIYNWSDGRRYEGEFRDNKFSGHGVFTWPNGSSYEGEWGEGKPNGEGKLTTANDTFNGIWTEGCFRRGRTVMAVGTDSASCPVFTGTNGPKRLPGGSVVGENEAQRRQLSALIACVVVGRKVDETCVSK